MNTRPSNPSNEIKEVFQYLRVKGAANAIEFYRRAFGASERFRLTEPSGRIEKVAPDEMQRRFTAMCGGAGSK